jgi:8-oxo-dGTP pyrophosphatase MutT (NUDIX family)
MPAKKISLGKAKPDKLFYFVANVVVYRPSDQRCLILRRGDHEVAHPGRWGVIGGKLEHNMLDLTKPTRRNGDILDFENVVGKLLKHEAKEEANVEINDELHYLNNMAFVRPDGIPVAFIKFAAKYKSGRVKPESGEHTDAAWVNVQEVKKYPCIDGIEAEIAQTIKIFQ